MNRQIQILKKDLLKAHEKLDAKPPTPSETAALAIPAAPTVAAAQPPPASFCTSTEASSCSSSTTAYGYGSKASVYAGISTPIL